jgi:two-component system sensor histidine kinase DesK
VGLCLVAMINILETVHSPLKLVAALVAMGGMLTVQTILLTDRALRWRLGSRVLAIALQASLGYLPFLLFGQAWVGMPGFVAGVALLILPGVWAIIAFAGFVAATGAIQAVIEPQLLLVSYTTVSTVLTGLIVYGLSRMSRLVVQLRRTRRELAHMAVVRERLRFARDLHDLLGYSLSAVTLKSELTRRLIGKNPERALTELEEIREISRQALADVRQLASGYRDMSLEDELRSARSVLAAADITVLMDVRHSALSPQVSSVLATVLREGVTNVLTHSKAENCTVIVSEHGGIVRLNIANDGVPEKPAEPPSPHGGSGVRNLTTRASALGGTLSTLTEVGWFRLSVELPLDAPRPATTEAQSQPAS